MKRVLVLFADNTFGLTQPLPPEGDAQVQLVEAALKDTVALCQDLQPSPGMAVPDLVLAYPGNRDWYSQIAPNYWLLVPQMGLNFAQRLDNLLIFLAPEPDDEILIVGPRTPHLTPRSLQQTYIALGQRGTCIGPTIRGGVYAVGVRGRWPAGVLHQVRWDEASAARDLQAVFRRLHLGVAILEDVQPLGEAHEVVRLIAALPPSEPRSLPFLKRLLRTTGLSGQT